MSFASFQINPKLLKAVEEMGFTNPTAIQTLAIPPLLEGRDVMASAVTPADAGYRRRWWRRRWWRRW